MYLRRRIDTPGTKTRSGLESTIFNLSETTTLLLKQLQNRNQAVHVGCGEEIEKIEIYGKFTSDDLNSHDESMARRMTTVNEAQGGYSK